MLPPEAIPILGIPVHAVTMDETLTLIEGYMLEPRVHQIATVNPEFVMAAQSDAAFRHTLLTADLCLPDGVGWRAIFGVSILCGIGFTMSLFIASLAFESSSQDIMAASRIGIVAGTAASALLGLLVLKLALPAGRAERGTGERLPIQPGT